MKKLLLITVLAVLFFSCKKDKDNKDSTVSLTGKWTYVKDSVNTYQNGELLNTQVFDYADEYHFIQFNKDGTGSDDNTTFTYKVTGDKIAFHTEAYTRDGIEYPAEDDEVKLIELSNNKLYFVYGDPKTSSVTIYATYKR